MLIALSIFLQQLAQVPGFMKSISKESYLKEAQFLYTKYCNNNFKINLLKFRDFPISINTVGLKAISSSTLIVMGDDITTYFMNVFTINFDYSSTRV